MNNSGGGAEHEPSTEKGLKMKIKRTKNIGQGTKTEGPNVSKHEIVKGAASNATSCGISNLNSSVHDSNSSSSASCNSLSTSVALQTNSTMASASTATTVTAPSTGSKMATHSPFEKLKQAILEQEKSKQAKQQQQKQEACKDKIKSETGLRDSGYGLNSVTFSRGLGSGVTGEGTSTIMSSGFATSLKQQKNDPYEFNAKNEDRLGNNAALPSATKKMKTEKVGVV